MTLRPRSIAAACAVLAAVALAGPGVAEAASTVTISPQPVAFGSVPANSIGPAVAVTVTNDGPDAFSFTGGQGVGANIRIASNGCTGTLAVNASCTIRIRFAPTATGTITNQGVSLQTSSGGPTVQINTSGTGTTALASPTFSTVAVPAGTGTSQVRNITAGPDDNLWFTDINSRVGRLTTLGGVAMFDLVAGTAPAQLTSGPDGNLWILHSGGSAHAVDAVTPQGQTLQHITAAAGDLGDLAFGADGRVSYTERARGIDSVNLDGSGFLNPQLPSTGAGSVDLYGLTRGPDDRLWAANFGPKQLVALSTAGIYTRYPVPVAPVSVVAGPDGALWFNGESSNTIGRMTTDGTVTTYAVTASQARGMTFDQQGRLWFGDINTSRIIRLDPATGIETDYTRPHGTWGIATGSDGNLWYATSGGLIGKIDLGLVPAASIAPASTDFGSVDVGTTSASRAVTVINAGPGLLTVSAASVADPAAFAATIRGGAGACARLPKGRTCTIDVTATPQAVGAASTTLTVTSNATNGQLTSSLTVTGTAPPVRSITLSTTELACAPALTFPNGACTTPTLTVTNSGAAGHVLVAGADATPAGGGTPWALCGGTGAPACASGPGADQFTASLLPAGGGALGLGTTSTPDTAFGPAGAATTGQAVTESVRIVGPSTSTSPASAFSTAVTWTAVP